MRFRSYAAAMLAAAAVFCLAPAARADIVNIVITDGTTTYDSSVPTQGSQSAGQASLNNFTLDGVKFTSVGANSLDNGGETLNFTSTLSSKNGQTAKTTITVTVTDTLTGGYSSFYTTGGLTQTIKAGTFNVGSTVNGTSDVPVVVPSASQGTTIPVTVASPGSSASIIQTATITGFVMTPKIQTGFTNTTVLTAVPEPTGVLIGLLGLPCMGAVVFFARRRASEMALVA